MREEDLNPGVDFIALRRTKRFRLFLGALALATLTIFVRSVFRCAELRGGFKGKLAQQQVTFMILEGAMIVIAVGLLTIWHPGWVFKEKWGDAAWSLRGRNPKLEEGKMVEGKAWEAPNGDEETVAEQNLAGPPYQAV